MITQVILGIFAILYYVFSIAVFLVCIKESEDMDFTDTLLVFLTAIFISPIAIPIILGVKLGTWIANN